MIITSQPFRLGESAMLSKHAGRRIVLALALLVPGVAAAGPFLGDWSWTWRPAADCTRGVYSPLHYWCPDCSRVRAFVRPSTLDQYPPGPYLPVPVTTEIMHHPCPSPPPIVPAPYADPVGYYYGVPGMH